MSFQSKKTSILTKRQADEDASPLNDINEFDSTWENIVMALDAQSTGHVEVNPAERLEAVLEIARNLGSSLAIDEVLPNILENVFRVFPQAERAYILLAEKPDEEPYLAAIRHRNKHSDDSFTIGPISRTITKQVMVEGKTILSTDASNDKRFEKNESIFDLEISSMMCAPLIGPSRYPLGAIYIDNQDPDQEFHEDDLYMLVSVATLAGQSVEHAHMLNKMLEDRRQAEKTLRASEARFRSVWDNSVDAMRLTDQQGIIVAVNRAYCKIVGMEAQQLEGKPFTCVYSREENLEESLYSYRQKFQQKAIEPYLEGHFIFQTAKSADLLVTNSLIETAPGKHLLLSIFHDETERKQTRQALLESETRFQTLINDVEVGIAVTNLQGCLLQVNSALQQILDDNEETLRDRHLADVIPIGSEVDFQQIYETLLNGERNEYHTELQFCRRDGRQVWGKLIMSLVQGSDGKPLHMIAMLEDVTDQKRLEKEVADLALQEQQRIGRELHDGLGQVLTGLGYLTKSLHQKLENHRMSEAQTVEQLNEGLQQALGQVRRMAKGLMPVEVDAGGLMIALQELAIQTQKWSGIFCQFQYNQSFQFEDPKIEIHLYHIVQEAVTNAVKHSQAQNILIDLHSSLEKVILSVQDDGVGIDFKGKRSAGIGLHIMRYRAEVLGATFDIRRAYPKGTLITCTLSRLPSQNSSSIKTHIA